jgi:hypothetical protein
MKRISLLLLGLLIMLSACATVSVNYCVDDGVCTRLEQRQGNCDDCKVTIPVVQPQIIDFGYESIYYVTTNQSTVLFKFNTTVAAVCDFTLNNLSPTSKTASHTDRHNFLFGDIAPGSYKINITCLDAKGFSFNSEFPVLIQAQTLFTHIKPQGYVDSAVVNLSFESNFNRDCRYTNQRMIYPVYYPQFGEGSFSRTVLSDGNVRYNATVIAIQGQNYYTVVCQPTIPPTNSFDPSLFITFDGNFEVVVPVALRNSNSTGQLTLLSDGTISQDLVVRTSHTHTNYKVGNVLPVSSVIDPLLVSSQFGMYVGNYTHNGVDYYYFGTIKNNTHTNFGSVGTVNYEWSTIDEFFYSNSEITRIDSNIILGNSHKIYLMSQYQSQVFGYYDIFSGTMFRSIDNRGQVPYSYVAIPSRWKVGPLALSPNSINATVLSSNFDKPQKLELKGSLQGANYVFNISINQNNMAGLHNMTGTLQSMWGGAPTQISSRNVTLTHVADCYFYADGRTSCQSKNTIPSGYISMVNFTLSPYISGTVNTSAPGNYSSAWVVPVWSGNLPRAS